MKTEQSQIDQLIEFKLRDKFSTKFWNDRGLNPSSSELCQSLTDFFDAFADKLIQAASSNDASIQSKKILKQQLSSLKKSHYDTEEKEFICDLFQELATITNIDFKDNLDKWLYGWFLATIFKIFKILNPEKIVETLKQPCSNCNIDLESYILKKEKGIPEYGWYLVRCKRCKELNLLSCGPDIKQIKFGNYEYAETLLKSEYTYEQALIRLEQIKFFRK